MRWGLGIAALLWVAVLAGCGSRTALDSVGSDAGWDSGGPPREDAAFDAGPDADRILRRDGGPDAQPPPDTGPQCVRDRAVLPPGDIDVLFVVDRSASMGWTVIGGTESRWAFLNDAMNGVFAELDPRVESGLYFFPGGGFCRLDEELHVPMAPDNVASVLDALAADPIEGRSRIAFALSEAYALLERDRGDAPNRFVVLLTDGNTERCPGDTMVFPEISVLQAHRDLGIDTFGVGVAGSATEHTRDGGRRAVSANDAARLRNVLAQIEQTLTGCVFDVPFAPSDPSHVTVRVGGVEVPHGRGWVFSGTDNASISLLGLACEERLATDQPVEAVVLCDGPDGG